MKIGRWLREKMGKLRGMAEGSSSRKSSGDGVVFVMEIVQLIANTQGDQEKVYAFFRANVGRLDEDLLNALPSVFANSIQRIDPSFIATVFRTLGDVSVYFPSGEPSK